MANDDESFNKEIATDSLEWHVTQFPIMKTGVVFWPAGIRKSVRCMLVVLWHKLGTFSAAFFADMMYELSCPFSEKAPVEANQSLCTTPPNLIVCNVPMTFV